MKRGWIAVIDKCLLASVSMQKKPIAKQKFPDKEPLLNFIPKKRLIYYPIKVIVKRGEES